MGFCWLDQGEQEVKILYVWDSEYPWDVRTHKICRALTEAGHEVHLVARNRARQALVAELPEGTVHRMRPLRGVARRMDGTLSFPAFANPRWVRLVVRVARDVRPDVILVRDLPLCPTAIWVGRSARVPVVLDMAENYPAMIRDIWLARRAKPQDVLLRNPMLVSVVERYCVPRVDHVLVVVRESGERLRSLGVADDRISVVSNTPPRARALDSADREIPAAKAREPGESRGKADGGGIRLVYLGLMEIPRGVGEALEALRLIRKRGARVRLRLIGDGRDLGHFREMARSLRLSAEEVEFLGHVPNETALRIVAESDVGLIPHHANESWNTTIPNKLFDYMAAGIPVVSSDAVPCARVVRETGCGKVFRSGDASDLADAVSGLTDEDVRRRLGEAGRTAVIQEYHWEADTYRLIQALEKVLGREPPPS